MDARTITAGLSVSPQISAADVQTVADHGFRAIICNRPDGEEVDQPSFDEIETVARGLGLETRYLPITPGQMQGVDADAFARMLTELPCPVLAYCRSGARCEALWALAVARNSVPNMPSET